MVSASLTVSYMVYRVNRVEGTQVSQDNYFIFAIGWFWRGFQHLWWVETVLFVCTEWIRYVTTGTQDKEGFV